MPKLDRQSLWSLERYAEERPAFRSKVIAHKKNRRLALGPNATLMFEDFLTMKYQVQEMLRTERIFEPDAIQEEIDAYNPLIPDGTNFKATLLLEFPDEAERRVRLAQMADLEHTLWCQVAGGAKLSAIANEDMERSNDEKPAAVHFLRFELDADAIAALRAGAEIGFGIDHPELKVEVMPTPAPTLASLLADLDS